MEGIALQLLVPRGQRPPSDYIDLLKLMLRRLRDETGEAGA